MKKKLIIIMTLLLVVTITGCKKKEKEEEGFTLTLEDSETMKKVSNLAFVIDKDSIKVEDYTNEEKEVIARQMVDNILESTGEEMRLEFQKYFGKDQTVEFHDIPCWNDPYALYIFNNETDKYESNPDHPGHGGEGKVTTQKLMGTPNLTIDGNTIYYDTKVLFYGPFYCSYGECNYGKLYKTYQDAINETNPIIEIKDTEYYIMNAEGPATANLETVVDDYKDKANTYRFTFVKEKDKLTFKEYKILKEE